MRVFMQNIQTTPKNKYFSTLEFTVSTVFQAEALAISEVAKNLLQEKIHNQSIVVLVDSQAAIKALTKCTVTTITMFNCIRNLNQFGKQNHVSIECLDSWTCRGTVHGNEVAHYEAKSRSKSKIHGPEPFIAVPHASCVITVKNWSIDRWKSMWNGEMNGRTA